MMAPVGHAKSGDWADALHGHNGAGDGPTGAWAGGAFVGAIGLLPRGAAK